FSLLLAREANVVIRNGAFASELRDHLSETLKTGAQEVRANQWQEQAWWQRQLGRWSYSLFRLLVGLSGYGNRP
ncbi:MAG: cardiolipin synthase ClsB, partial [Betaproteobacteria bacterium]|nr:cardiolipin synthase ClsB [Betaproteobacteria bacterium]